MCLCSMHAAARGPESVYVWPSCGHTLHLGCVAHMRVNQAWVSCPICRSGWSEVAERQLTQMCRQEAVPVPEAAADYDTNSVQIPAEPPAPAGVVALCCHHLALIDGSRAQSEDAWVALPTRLMTWAPVRDRSTGEWQPEWTCLRCNAWVTSEHPMLQQVPAVPCCAAHGPRTLALDIAHGQRGWVCCQGYPPDILPCAGAQLPMPALVPQPWPAPQPLPSTRLAPQPQPQQQQPRQEQQRPSPEPAPAPADTAAAGAHASTNACQAWHLVALQGPAGHQ